MDDQKITAEELKTLWAKDVDALAQKVADAINAARPGAIIDESEEPVRDANAVFREKAYQQALGLLQDKNLQEAFSPRQTRPEIRWHNKGRQKTSHLTVNGLVELDRSIYWNRRAGTVAPLDALLGITASHYSVGVREMACRLSLNGAFVPASETLARTAQLTISSSALRDLVLAEGTRCEQAICGGQYGPDWTAGDCTDQTLISGADGVMAPTVTESQKVKRRATEAAKRKRQGRKSTRRVGRPKSGANGPYKELKLVTFYDPDKTHQYAVGTGGNHEVLGRIMRREALKLEIGQAKTTYAVTDGAEWIAKQYRTQLPMLDMHILDYYHLRDHVIKASYALYGEGTAKATAWREDMMAAVWTQGSLVMLDKLGNYLGRHRKGAKHEALKSLRDYVAKRVEMTDYPSFRAAGYDCGSGPTESFCGCLTKRLKGRGMRWDKDNAEAMMALGSVYYSHLWSDYWARQRHVA
jgi:hypothetical protein